MDKRARAEGRFDGAPWDAFADYTMDADHACWRIHRFVFIQTFTKQIKSIEISTDEFSMLQEGANSVQLAATVTFSGSDETNPFTCHVKLRKLDHPCNPKVRVDVCQDDINSAIKLMSANADATDGRLQPVFGAMALWGEAPMFLPT